jgi:hypothetical protein
VLNFPFSGLAFANLGDFFSGNNSKTNSQVIFTVTALTGLITGDYVAMTSYSATGANGEATASLYDGSDALLTIGVSCFSCSSPPDLTNSKTFAGIGSTPVYASVAAVNTGFSGGSATVDGVTALFATTVVPVPATVWLFGSGLLGLFGVARRKAA